MADKVTPSQFAKAIKDKYPQYNSVPDEQLVSAIVEKYPQYKEQILEVHPDSGVSISGPPKGTAALKSEINTGLDRARKKIVEYLPTIGATVGAIAAAPSGPGAVAGAAVGGAAGKALQQIEGASRGKGEKSSSDAAGAIVLEGGIQGLFELGGLGLAKVAKMIAPTERAGLLAYGAKSGELGEKAFEKLIPEFDKTLAVQGSRGAKTVGEFEKVVTSTQARLGNEYGLAMQPIRGQKIIPIDVANAIRAMKRTPKTAEDVAFNRVLDRRALEFEKQAWTIGELDERRSILAKRNLAGKERQSISSVMADTKLDGEIAADKAANKALNDTIYPALDRANGKPAGYFADLQSKQRTLYTLRDSVQKAKRTLTKGQLEQSGAPLSEKVHLRAYEHPQSLKPGGVIGVSPSMFSNPMKRADKAIARGFPSSTRKVINAGRKALSTPISNATLDALPIRVLWEQANEEPDEPKTPGQMKKELKAIVNKTAPPSSNPLSPRAEQ